MGRMKRCTPTDMAEMAGVHANTIRRWTNNGIITCTKDFHGWRWFPDPAATLKQIRQLMDGTAVIEGGDIDVGDS